MPNIVSDAKFVAMKVAEKEKEKKEKKDKSEKKSKKEKKEKSKKEKKEVNSDDDEALLSDDE
jgi:hypothetical protein